MAGNEYKTNNRTRIKDYLVANKDKTVSVSDIDEHLKEEQNPVNVTTIYRYLDKLEQDGDILKYNQGDGSKATYQFVDREHKCDEHLHLKCQNCGAIVHLDCHFMEEIAQHVGKEHGFEIQCKNSVIYGICERCRQLK